MYSQKEVKEMVRKHGLLDRFPKEDKFVGFSDGNIFLGSKVNAIKLHQLETKKKPIEFHRAEFEADEAPELSEQPLGDDPENAIIEEAITEPKATETPRRRAKK